MCIEAIELKGCETAKGLEIAEGGGSKTHPRHSAGFFGLKGQGKCGQAQNKVVGGRVGEGYLAKSEGRIGRIGKQEGCLGRSTSTCRGDVLARGNLWERLLGDLGLQLDGVRVSAEARDTAQKQPRFIASLERRGGVDEGQDMLMALLFKPRDRRIGAKLGCAASKSREDIDLCVGEGAFGFGESDRQKSVAGITRPKMPERNDVMGEDDVGGSQFGSERKLGDKSIGLIGLLEAKQGFALESSVMAGHPLKLNTCGCARSKAQREMLKGRQPTLGLIGGKQGLNRRSSRDIGKDDFLVACVGEINVVQSRRSAGLGRWGGGFGDLGLDALRKRSILADHHARERDRKQFALSFMAGRDVDFCLITPEHRDL